MPSRHTTTRSRWEDKKDVILALAADNPLKSVVKLMREQHNFTATVAQYEYHLKEWNAPAKHLKRGDWARVIAVYDSLASQHENVRLLVNDSPLSATKLQRNWRLYASAGSNSLRHVRDAQVSLPDIVSFQRLSPTGTWLQLTVGPESGPSGNEISPPNPALDFVGTEIQPQEATTSLLPVISQMGVVCQGPLDFSPRSPSFSFLGIKDIPSTAESTSLLLPRSLPVAFELDFDTEISICNQSPHFHAAEDSSILPWERNGWSQSCHGAHPRVSRKGFVVAQRGSYLVEAPPPVMPRLIPLTRLNFRATEPSTQSTGLDFDAITSVFQTKVLPTFTHPAVHALHRPEPTTPLAEAIWVQSKELIQICEDAESLEWLSEDYGHFKAAITAASHTHNLVSMQKILHYNPSSSPGDIMLALEVSAKEGDDNMTSVLLSAYHEKDPLLAAISQLDWAMVNSLLDSSPDHNPLDPADFKRVPTWNGHKIYQQNLFESLLQLGDRHLILNAAKTFPTKTNEDTHWEIPLARFNKELLPFLHEQKLVLSCGLVRYLKSSLKIKDDSSVRFLVNIGANPVDSTVLESAVTHGPHLLAFLLQSVPRPILEFISKEVDDREPINMTVWPAINSALEQGLLGLPSLKYLFESEIIDMSKVGMWWADARDGEVSCLVDLRRAIRATTRGDNGNFAVVRFLLDSGCDPNTHHHAGPFRRRGELDEKYEASALLQAIASKHASLVELLIQKGAKVNWTTWMDITPLQKAVELSCLDIVKLLLDHGADVNAPAPSRIIRWRDGIGAGGCQRKLRCCLRAS